jgi:hypothetical protein
MKTKQSRRDFLRMSAAGALGAVAVTQMNCKTGNRPAPSAADAVSTGIGLQLYLSLCDSVYSLCPDSYRDSV